MVDRDVIPSGEVFPVARPGTRTLTYGESDLVDIGSKSEGELMARQPRVAIIRTSDRIAFRGCRRRWGWSSHLRHNRGSKHGVGPLWFGTGIHFALEDFHGYNFFQHPRAAFEEYVRASVEHNKAKLPNDWEELRDLGQGMMDYYVIWLGLRPHSTLKTLYLNGIPQVEVNARIRVPWEKGKFGYDEVWYSLTIDRMCVDDQYDLVWPLDYKTAKSIETFHFLTDPQINAYMWAAPLIYDLPIGGFKYMQFKKAIPNAGRVLQNGGVSFAATQMGSTTAWMYKQTLIEVYKSTNRAPEGCQQLLRQLTMQEDENKDAFVQLDTVHRNERMGQSEGVKILLEIEDMLNPDLPLYPNPTRFCVNSWKPEFSCPFLSPCVSLDDGGDWVHELEATTDLRESKYDSWREKIRWPGQELTQQQITKAAAEGEYNRDWLNTIDI